MGDPYEGMSVWEVYIEERWEYAPEDWENIRSPFTVAAPNIEAAIEKAKLQVPVSLEDLDDDGEPTGKVYALLGTRAFKVERTAVLDA